MARGDPNLVWVEGFTSPVRLSDIIKPPRGYGLGPAQHAAAPARALWAAREAEPPPPPERAARGDTAVTHAPVRARAQPAPAVWRDTGWLQAASGLLKWLACQDAGCCMCTSWQARLCRPH